MLKVAIRGDLKKVMESELKLAGGSLRSGIRRASSNLKRDADRQMARSGIRPFQRGKSEWWRKVVLNTKENSGLGTRGIVFSGFARAAQAFEEGATIRAKNGTWLAIPTQAVTAASMIFTSQGLLQRKSRLKLMAPRFFNLPAARTMHGGATAFVPTRNPNVAKIVLRRPGQPEVVLFWLHRQVRIQKKISFYDAAEKWGDRLPEYVVNDWERRNKAASDG